MATLSTRYTENQHRKLAAAALSGWLGSETFGMPNRTEPKTAAQWIRYIVVAVIALWLVVWTLRISGSMLSDYAQPILQTVASQGTQRVPLLELAGS